MKSEKFAVRDAYFKIKNKKYEKTPQVFTSRIATTDFVAYGFNHRKNVKVKNVMLILK